MSVFCKKGPESQELVVAGAEESLHGFGARFLQLEDVVADVSAAKFDVDEVFALFEDGAAGLQLAPADRVGTASHGDVL